MLGKILIFIFVSIFALQSTCFAQHIDEIDFMTENYPPFNFKKNNHLQGIAVDLLFLMLKKIDSTKTRSDIRVLPWARAYDSVLTEEKTALFSMTRTKKRENLFKWVGPISNTTIALIARKEKNIKIDSIEDIKKYKLGVVRDDIGEQLLITLGINQSKIESTGGVDAIHKLIKMLNRDRFDLLSYEFDVARWEMKNLGFHTKDYQLVYKLSQAQLYFAFHKNTPDDLINLLQEALDELKKDKKYQEIIQKYR